MSSQLLAYGKISWIAMCLLVLDAQKMCTFTSINGGELFLIYGFSFQVLGLNLCMGM